MGGMERSSKSVGLPYLYSFWRRRSGSIDGKSNDADDHKHWVNDNTLLSGLGLGLQETFAYLYSARPAFDEFERWVLERNGGAIEQHRIDRLNDALAGTVANSPTDTSPAPVLTSDEMAFWEEYGYVILHDAAPQETCSDAATAIYEFVGADPEDPASWYHKPIGHTIWVPLLHHPALDANRHSPRIR